MLLEKQLEGEKKRRKKIQELRTWVGGVDERKLGEKVRRGTKTL